ncbi:hypothetical protein ISCGN_018367 [Ixodes scapularis]
MAAFVPRVDGSRFFWTRPVPREDRVSGPELEVVARPYRDIEARLNYTFRDKGLLLDAFTHDSFPKELRVTSGSMRPMDFLGDALLKLLISTHLYGCLDPLTNRNLTETRQKLECNRFFAYLAVRHGMHKFLRSASGSLNDEVVRYAQSVGDRDYTAIVAQMPPKPLADLFEALAAAVYLDSNLDLDALWCVVYPIFRSHIDRELGHSPA